MNKSPIILFGNGEVPTHPSSLKVINNAKFIVCLDGGTDKLIKLGHKPDYVLGDLDSLRLKPHEYGCEVVELPDQTKNDLDKGLDWCLDQNMNDIILIGFSGRRDDHNMAALYSLRSFSDKMNLVIYTDHSIIHCLKGRSEFSVVNGQIISLIASDSKTSITTRGLGHELNNDRLSSPGHGISNVAAMNQIEIESDDWIWVFLNHME